MILRKLNRLVDTEKLTTEEINRLKVEGYEEVTDKPKAKKPKDEKPEDKKPDEL